MSVLLLNKFCQAAFVLCLCAVAVQAQIPPARQGRPLPALRKHDVAGYYLQQKFRRIEYAADQLSEDTLSSLYSRSRLRIQEPDRVKKAVSQGAVRPLAQRPTRRTARVVSKSRTAEPTKGTIEAAKTAKDSGSAIQTGLPDGILSPVETP